MIGAINWDINLFVRNFPQRGEEVRVRNITRVAGGKAGNVAVAAARILGPSQVAIIGGLGNDAIATEQIRIFQQEGVIVSGIKTSPEAESGQAYIVIDESGENVIHTFFGANATVTPEDLDEPSRRELLSQTAVVTIMDPLFETSVRLAQEAKQMSKVVAWDPGVRSELGIEGVAPLIENVDYLAANESELANLAGTRDTDKAAEKIIQFNSKVKVAAKLGGRGCALYTKDGKVELPALDLKARGLKVVNTVGCGDAFLGAFVAALSEGRSDLEALKWGNCAAGLKATREETRGCPNRETLLKNLS